MYSGHNKILILDVYALCDKWDVKHTLFCQDRPYLFSLGIISHIFDENFQSFEMEFSDKKKCTAVLC